MKTNLTKQKSILLTVMFLVLFCCRGYSQGPNDYSVCIDNIAQTAPNILEFDIIAHWTGTNTQKMTFFQAGINFNYAGMANGGVMTGAFIAGSASSSVSFIQQSPNWNINSTSKQIRMLASIASEAFATPIPPPPGHRLGRFRITNTQSFTPLSTPNFVWSFATGSGSTTKTGLSCYLNGATTGTDVTTNAFHCVNGNPQLNPPCPTADAGGPYTSCGDIHLNGSIQFATTGTWSSSGSGTFDPNNTTLNATYHPSAADLGNGSVTLTLTTDAGAPGCSPATSTATATFTSIDDNDVCTTDGCDQATGTATHTPVNTDDGNVCTTDGCDPVTGVFHNTISVDDGNPCTDDSCDPIAGPQHTPTNVDDGNACTNDGCDTATGVFHTPVNTDDGDACTTDACDPATGNISHTPVNVDDGDACTVDQCTNTIAPTTLTFSGATGLPLTWSSTSPGLPNFDEAHLNVSGFAPGSTITDVSLTIDIAHTWGGDIHMVLEGPGPAFPFVGILRDPNDDHSEFGSAGGTSPLPYTFNNSGTTIPVVGPVPSPGPYLPKTYPGGVDTNTDGFDGTDPNGGWTLYMADPVNFDGGTIDNMQLTITAVGPVAVITHTPVNTDDGNACTTDACDPATGNITHTPVNTDDGDACTTDACDTVTGAVTHTAVNTDDGNACTTDACDPATGNVTNTPVNTDDGDGCTIDACDTVTGAVTHTAVNTDDGNACTVDACDPSTGNVTHTAVNTDDGDACTIDACDTVTGAVTHTAVNTDDGDACTVDACDPSTGNVTHTPVNIDDGDACTVDACDPSTGNVTHTAVNTDDGNACTVDACDPATGNITHTDITDDGNACTTDACDTVTGVATHTPVDPNDGNACTTDACDPATGVSNTPVNTDDGNPCTVDACDTVTGAVTHTDNSPSVSATGGTILCYGGTTCVTVTATGGTPPYSGDGVQCGYGAGTYTFDVTDAAGCTVTSNAVTLTEPDKLEVSTTSTDSDGSNGTATATATGGTGTISYQWNDPNNQTTSTATGLAPGNYCVVVTDDNGCTSQSCVTVNSSCNLTAPGPIVGPDGTCRKQVGVVYCVTPNPFATSYQWILPLGAVATGSTTGPCITLKFTSKWKGGFICAKAITPCGTTAAACKNVTYVSTRPATPGVISGPVSLCPGDVATYSIAPVPGATSYLWDEDNLIILSGQGTTSVTVQAKPGFTSGKIKVKSINCKDDSGWRTLNLSKNPPKPVAISGPANVCPGQTVSYSIAAVQNASNYVWQVNNGMIILSGQGTTSISVQIPANFASGEVKVKAQSPCGGQSGDTKLAIETPGCRVAANGDVISDDALSAINAYPNPTTGKAMISFTSNVDAKYTLKVVDMIGKVLISETLSVVEGYNMKEVNLEGMSKGIYMISVQTEEGSAQTLRLIVE